MQSEIVLKYNVHRIKRRKEMKEVILDAQIRETGSKSGLESFRKQGKIPAVIYGKDINPDSIYVD